jgi:opacity protein-like surface antigen
MHVRHVIISAVAALALVAAAPATASADWTFSPFIGAAFSGGVNDPDLNESTGNRLSWGGSLAWMGQGIAGFELDFGYAPEFFRADVNDNNPFIGDGNVATLMGNVIVSAPIGGLGTSVRPYAVGGLGLIRQKVDDIDDVFDADDNSLGFDLGGGLMGMFSENVGIRGDIRYFRSFRNDSSGLRDIDFDLTRLNFWRGTVGLTFRFGS